MNSLALILLVAAAGHGLARWTRLPVIPLLLFAGIGLAVSGLLPQDEFTVGAFELGLAFLVFTAGMELNPDQEKIAVPYNQVAPYYFETMGTRLIRGRAFDRRDHRDASNQRVV